MAQAESLEGRWRAFAREEGLKSTRQRRAIFEAFAEMERHASLDELLAVVQERLPSVGYATVYRTMKLFVAAGIALERQFGDGQTRFEAVHDEDEHHDHMICKTCGAIFEFEDDQIEARQVAVAQSFGLRIVRHRLDIWGECIEPDSCERRKAQGTH